MNISEPQPGLTTGSESRPGLIATLAVWQLLATIVLSVLFWTIFDTRVAISSMFGGAIAAFMSLYMAGRLFASRNGIDARYMLMRFYSSIVLKILFTLTMMVLCIVFIKVSIAPFIIAYLVAALLVNWLFLFFTEA